MNPAQQIRAKFRKWAHSKGYTTPVEGENAYTNPEGKIMRLTSFRNLIVLEEATKRTYTIKNEQ